MQGRGCMWTVSANTKWLVEEGCGTKTIDTHQSQRMPPNSCLSWVQHRIMFFESWSRKDIKQWSKCTALVFDPQRSKSREAVYRFPLRPLESQRHHTQQLSLGGQAFGTSHRSQPSPLYQLYEGTQVVNINLENISQVADQTVISTQFTLPWPQFVQNIATLSALHISRPSVLSANDKWSVLFHRLFILMIL